MRKSINYKVLAAAACVAVASGLAYAQSSPGSSTSNAGTPGLSADRGNPSGVDVQRPGSPTNSGTAAPGSGVNSNRTGNSTSEAGTQGLSADRGNPSGVGVQRPDAPANSNPSSSRQPAMGSSAQNSSAGVNADGSRNDGSGGAILNSDGTRTPRQDRN